MSINFKQITMHVLKEENVAGGAGSVYGSAVTKTAGAMSSDSYSPGYNILPFARPGIATRGGVIGGKKSNTTKSRKRKKKK